MRTSFWWDRDIRTVNADLRAVIFDADSALAGVDGNAASDLVDAAMSLFVAGIWVGVVSVRPRLLVQSAVRHLLGDGLVETIVTTDDLPEPDVVRHGELYRLALWEMGITPRGALAVTGPGAGLCTWATAGLPAVAVQHASSAASCQQAHRRWWLRQAA